ncbi:MAG: hypothetical protein OXP09_03015 [Gammaproteobacteria bacterium]|nr:hypothetical protein [Gammaproteobacteria bacterium]
MFSRRASLGFGVRAVGAAALLRGWPASAGGVQGESPGSFDVTGGYDPALDYLLAQRPDDPAMRESVSMWISDDAGRFGFPRFCIEALAGAWEQRGVQANIAFPDGRVLNGAGGFAPAPAKLVEGRAVTLNAGPLTFEVVEPLRRWRMTFDGNADETTVMRQAMGEQGGRARRVRIEIDAVMAAPPWTPGEQAARIGDRVTERAVGAVGGHRHEQLFRCSGRFAIEGESDLAFTGTGLKIRRFGVRNVGDFPGHCWQSALFPSGRAFGMMAFPPRSDGTPAYSEGYVFDGRRKIYARLVEAPWMTGFVPHGGPVDVVLETEAGRTRITGKTHDSTYLTQGVPMFGDWPHDRGSALPFHQGGALYTWGDESAYGMIERSLPANGSSG